jgi:hypothetical protein
LLAARLGGVIWIGVSSEEVRVLRRQMAAIARL